MKRRAILVCLAGAALTGASAGPALAQTVPSGNSEVDQYSESLPAPGGNKTIKPPGGGNAGGAGGRSVVPQGTASQLEQLGPAGRAAAALAESTAPKDSAGRSKGAGRDAKDASGSSAFSAVSDAVTGSDGDGLGILLPLILGAVAATGIGYAVMRRRVRQAR